jgi:hypothetical protein
MSTYAQMKVHELDERIKAVQAKIRKFDRDIQQAQLDRAHDPFKFDREIYRLNALKRVELERIAILANERRSELPAGSGDDWKPSNSVWLNDKY